MYLESLDFQVAHMWGRFAKAKTKGSLSRRKVRIGNRAPRELEFYRNVQIINFYSMCHCKICSQTKHTFANKILQQRVCVAMVVRAGESLATKGRKIVRFASAERWILRGIHPKAKSFSGTITRFTTNTNMVTMVIMVTKIMVMPLMEFQVVAKLQGGASRHMCFC